jgi:ankyrin repeat protein
VKLLLAAEADCSKSDESGLSPLHAAACAVQDETVSALIAAGAPVDAVDACGSTPLHYAAMLGNEQPAEELLKADANFGMANEAGEDPLSVALGEYDTDEIVALRYKLAMVAAKGQSKAAPMVAERDLVS